MRCISEPNRKQIPKIKKLNINKITNFTYHDSNRVTRKEKFNSIKIRKIPDNLLHSQRSKKNYDLIKNKFASLTGQGNKKMKNLNNVPINNIITSTPKTPLYITNIKTLDDETRIKDMPKGTKQKSSISSSNKSSKRSSSTAYGKIKY
jgi:hypothetical protein